MELGEKLKRARTEAGLTQDDVSILLDVSRQTISNWENGKTYPDIGAVLKLSDVYKIPLNGLLQENTGGYLTHLKMQERQYQKQHIWEQGMVLGIFAILWVFCFARLSLSSNADLLGNVVLLLRIFYPAVTAALSFVIGCRDYWRWWKWITPFVTAAFGFFLVLFALRTALFTWFLWPSLIGLATGCGFRWILSRKRERKWILGAH